MASVVVSTAAPAAPVGDASDAGAPIASATSTASATANAVAAGEEHDRQVGGEDDDAYDAVPPVAVAPARAVNERGEPEVVHGEQAPQRRKPGGGGGRRRCRDVVFLWAWVAQFIVILLVGFVVASGGSHYTWLGGRKGVAIVRGWFIAAAIVGWALGLLVLALLTVPWVHIDILRWSHPLYALLFVVMSIVLFAEGTHWFLGVLMVLLVLVDTAWIVRARDRLGFVTVLFDVAAKVLRTGANDDESSGSSGGSSSSGGGGDGGAGSGGSGLGGVGAGSRRRLQHIIIGITGVQALFLVLWAFIAANVMRTGTGRIADAVLMGTMLFSLRWTTTVLKGVLRITVSGTVMLDLLATGSQAAADAEDDEDEEFGLAVGDDDEGTDDEAAPLAGRGGSGSGAGAGAGAGAGSASGSSGGGGGSNHGGLVPLDFAKQALTTSLGSVCAGALVGSVSPLLWALLYALRRLEHGPVCGRTAGTMASAVQSFLMLSHKYAYPEVRVAATCAGGCPCACVCMHVDALLRGSLCKNQVALHGTPWFRAARETWKAFDNRGLEAVVDDDCSDRILLFVCYVAGGAFALVCLV